MQADRKTIEKIARAHGTGGWQTLEDMIRFGTAIAQRAAEAERKAMKPHIIQALEEAETEMENYSYFGSNRGVPKDVYEDVADAAILSRSSKATP